MEKGEGCVTKSNQQIHKTLTFKKVLKKFKTPILEETNILAAIFNLYSFWTIIQKNMLAKRDCQPKVSARWKLLEAKSGCQLK